jgi:ribonuclease T2
MNVRVLYARLGVALGLLALLGLCSAPALARHHGSSSTEGGPSGQFDYYLLALSWAPSYCLVHPGDRAECGSKGYGFVLHGLWPQLNGGGYPENCQGDATLDAAAVAIGGTIYPSPRLMEHEWATHGTCSGLAAADYFRLADQALAVLKVPQQFEAPATHQALSAEQIAAAFLTANPGLGTQALVLGCSRDTLSEVRICLTRDLKPRGCGRGVRSSCYRDPVQVPSSR